MHFLRYKIMEQLKNLKNGPVPCLGLEHVIKCRIHLVRQFPLVTCRIRDETQCRVEDILENKEDDETRALVEVSHQLQHRHRVVLRQARRLQAVLRIHDILGWIRIRIRHAPN